MKNITFVAVVIRNHKGLDLSLAINPLEFILTCIFFGLIGILFILDLFDEYKNSQIPPLEEKREWVYEDEVEIPLDITK